jgi:hypothetical protein
MSPMRPQRCLPCRGGAGGQPDSQQAGELCLRHIRESAPPLPRSLSRPKPATPRVIHVCACVCVCVLLVCRFPHSPSLLLVCSCWLQSCRCLTSDGGIIRISRRDAQPPRLRGCGARLGRELRRLPVVARVQVSGARSAARHELAIRPAQCARQRSARPRQRPGTRQASCSEPAS